MGSRAVVPGHTQQRALRGGLQPAGPGQEGRQMHDSFSTGLGMRPRLVTRERDRGQCCHTTGDSVVPS